MPRQPTSIQTGFYGSNNPNSPQNTARSLPQPSTRVKPPTQRREHSKDRQFNAIQDASARAARNATAAPWADGQNIPGVTFTALKNQVIQHKLGRVSVGYMVHNCGPGFSPGNVTLVSHGTFITLLANGNGTADIWVW